MTCDDVLRNYIWLHLQFSTHFYQFVGFFFSCILPIILLKFITDVWEDMSVSNSISHILMKVLNFPLLIIELHMVIEPSHQNILRLQFEEYIIILSFFFEHHHLRYISQGDLSEEVHSDKLPDETQRNMLLLLSNEVRVDVNDNTACRFGCWYG